jgi:hypothetical protein
MSEKHGKERENESGMREKRNTTMKLFVGVKRLLRPQLIVPVDNNALNLPSVAIPSLIV